MPCPLPCRLGGACAFSHGWGRAVPAVMGAVRAPCPRAVASRMRRETRPAASMRRMLLRTRPVSPSLARSLGRSAERRRTGVARRRIAEIASRDSIAGAGDPMFVDSWSAFRRRVLSWGLLVGLCRTDAAQCIRAALAPCRRRVEGEESTMNVGAWGRPARLIRRCAGAFRTAVGARCPAVPVRSARA
jgi:hypothetical protein